MGAVLPVDLQRELELPCIIRRCSLARIGKQRTDGRDVVPVGDVEHVCDQVHVEALAKIDAFRNAQIVEDRPGSHTGIAAQVAIKLQQCGDGLSGDEAVNARLLQSPGRGERGFYGCTASGIDECVGSSCQRRQLEVITVAGNDVEWPSRTELNKRRECPVAENPTGESAS